MEIKINIPQNDYVQPKDVRESVVQGICEAFLDGCAWSTYHPFSEGCYRRATDKIIKHRNDKAFYGFHDEPFTNEEAVRFNGAEMKAAFRVLRNAGYHMFRVYIYGSWMGYKCSKKPYMEGGNEVFEFNDFID